ncbi:MAG TPA: hypothetical protein VGM69_25425 [Chloroflexota bacterium]|jgi:hypothetical protein
MDGTDNVDLARNAADRQSRGRRVDDAKAFIRRLFEQGGTDADTATTCLLALDKTAREQRRQQKLIGRRRADDWAQTAADRSRPPPR